MGSRPHNIGSEIKIYKIHFGFTDSVQASLLCKEWLLYIMLNCLMFISVMAKSRVNMHLLQYDVL